MRRLNFTIEIEDNDLAEYNLTKEIANLVGPEKIVGFIVFPNIEHLKEDSHYKKLVKAKKEAGLLLDRYINENR